jgi:hypothetical protein
MTTRAEYRAAGFGSEPEKLDSNDLVAGPFVIAPACAIDRSGRKQSCGHAGVVQW